MGQHRDDDHWKHAPHFIFIIFRMRIMILALCTFGVSAQMSLLNKIDPHSMLPGRQFGNQYGSNEPIDDDVRFINYSITEIQAYFRKRYCPKNRSIR